MIVRHYLELLRYYRRLVILIVSGVTSATLAICLVFMTVAPIYTAETQIVMLPTESELAFTRSWTASSTFDPASIMVHTHEQYLLSRTVAERALDKLMATFPKPPPATGFKAQLRTAFKTFQRTLWRVYATLNYGTYVPASEREELLNDLQDAIKLEWVEGSYIMLLSADYGIPEGAAMIANATAQAYVEIKQEAIARVAADILAELGKQEQAKVLQLDALRAREAAIDESLGVQDRAATRQSVLDAISVQQDGTRADQLQLARMTARVDQLTQDEHRLRSLGLAGSIEQEIALAQAERRSLETSLETRRQTTQELEQRLASLTSVEQELDTIADQKTAIQASLEAISQRQRTAELAANTAIDQVRIIDLARAPVYPFFPKTLIMTLAALIGSGLLSMFVIVAIDTFSNTVKTSADLRRLFGERSLDRVPRAFCRRLSTMSGVGAASALQRHGVVAELSTRLRLLGAVFPSSILILGLRSERAVGCATRAIAIACTASGMNVHVPDGTDAGAPDEVPEPTRSSLVQARYDGCTDIAVRPVGLVGRSLDWFQVTQDLNVLVCAVTPGEAAESLLTKFDAEASARGVPLVLFILCDA